jgi:hypothetical protein
MRRLRKVTLAGSLACALTVGAVLTTVTAQAGTTPGVTVTVVSSGLNAPKHLTFAGNSLFVTESGSGGPVGQANCVTGPSEGGGTTQFCEGSTGAIAVVHGSHVTPVSPGLPSVIEEDNQEVSGAAAVAFNRDGQAAVVVQDALVNAQGGNALPKPLGSGFGKLLLVSGRKVITVDIAQFTATHPQPASSLGNVPGETAYDSDPYEVVAYGSGFVVADAAGDSLLQVSRSGQVALLARFPTLDETIPAGLIGNPEPEVIESQAVPTSIAVGPDGALYVGLLRGFPSFAGSADIYRVVPGQAPTIWAQGLDEITAIAFDHQGRLLATEYSTGSLLSPPTVPGALVRISDHGQVVTTLPVSGLYQPTGVAVGSGGTVYVSNYGASLATATNPGEILKITGLG